MRVQQVEPDGNCLYRSLACALIHVFTGKNVGKGAPWGSEKNIGDIFQNAVMQWIRVLVAHRLATGMPLRADTEFDGKSLFSVLMRMNKLLKKHQTSAKLKSRTAARHIMRKLKPTLPRLKPTDEGRMSVYPCGLTADDLSLSGRGEHESFQKYCRRIHSRGSWGGEAECYVASLVLCLPVCVYQKFEKVICYNADGARKVPLTIAFVNGEHYDAILGSEFPPLFHQKL